MRKTFILFLSLPKTIYFNLRAFRFAIAIKLPIIIGYKTKIGEIGKNRIILNNYEKHKYRIIFGLGGSKHVISNKSNFISVGEKGKIFFNGSANFAEGTSLRCDYGKLNFGKNTSVNKNCCFNCEYEMKFGNDFLTGWNCNFRDTDGHLIYTKGVKKINQKKIIVGNHVWICSYVDILKGAIIGNDTVVAWKSCVTRKIEKNNCIIGGIPANILEENITWEI